MIFFRHFVDFLPKRQPFWTTFETLAEIERDCRATTMHGRLRKYRHNVVLHNMNFRNTQYIQPSRVYTQFIFQIISVTLRL